MFSRDQTYENLCEHAYTAETIVISKKIHEDKGPTAVLGSLTYPERQQDNYKI